MPCNDVTEFVEIRFDDHDRLMGLEVRKNTCGAPVGREVLLPCVLGMQIEDILELSFEALLPEARRINSLERFMLHKQFRALQAALQTYVGDAPGSVHGEAPFIIESVEYTEKGTALSGLLRVNHISTSDITPCKSCCGQS